MKLKTNKGFTLIELLVVISIISLLSTIVLASLNLARAKAVDAKILAEYRQVLIAMEVYYNNNGSYPEETSYGSQFCIGGNDCLLLGTLVNNPLAGITVDSNKYAQSPFQLYKVASANSIGYIPSINQYTILDVNGLENRGFVYSVPLDQSKKPEIKFTTDNLGPVKATVGIGSLSSNTN